MKRSRGFHRVRITSSHARQRRPRRPSSAPIVLLPLPGAPRSTTASTTRPRVWAAIRMCHETPVPGGGGGSAAARAGAWLQSAIVATVLFDAVERQQLCDLLVELGPDSPTLLEAWSTRDLAAHLVLREHDHLAAPGLVLPGP